MKRRVPLNKRVSPAFFSLPSKREQCVWDEKGPSASQSSLTFTPSAHAPVPLPPDFRRRMQRTAQGTPLSAAAAWSQGPGSVCRVIRSGGPSAEQAALLCGGCH